MENDIKNMFPIIIGKKGIDPYYMKYATGEEIPWPTEYDIKLWKKEDEIFDNEDDSNQINLNQ